MRFKITFQQSVEGIETCEAVIEANDEYEALTKLERRDFTTYLVTKQEADRYLSPDFEPVVRVVEGT